MPGGNVFIVMLLWTFVGRGIDGETVTGMFHGRVELRGHYGRSPDVAKVEWNKYVAENSTPKLLCAILPNDTVCTEPCQNIGFHLQNKSLILVHLTKSDEGIYEEKITFKNNTILRFKNTLSVLCENSTSTSPSVNNTCPVSNENRTSAAHCNVSVGACSILFFSGLSLIILLALCIILFFTCKYYDRRKIKTASAEEPVYEEPTSSQEEAVRPTVGPLLIVYEDFIKPKISHQSEDFGYSTIADVLDKTEPSQTP